MRIGPTELVIIILVVIVLCLIFLFSKLKKADEESDQVFAGNLASLAEGSKASYVLAFNARNKGSCCIASHFVSRWNRRPYILSGKAGIRYIVFSI